MSDADPQSAVQEYRALRRQRELPQFILDHIRQYEEDPVKAHLFDCSFAGGLPDTPTLMLSTTGRKSERPTAPMPLIYGQDGDRYVIVGSNGGMPTHTAWYLNLQVNPDVEVQVAAERFRASAYTASGDERSRLWDMMAKVYPPYLDYEKATERVIPVVVLERRPT